MKFLRDYQKLHEGGDYGLGGGIPVEQIAKFCKGKKVNKILDYGCGRSNAAINLATNLAGEKNSEFTICRYDPAIEELSDFPEDKYHLGLCTDVVEHVPENELDIFLRRFASCLYRNAIAFFIVHTAKANAQLPYSKVNAHVSIKKASVWRELFLNYFNEVEIVKHAVKAPRFLIRADDPIRN